MASIVARCFLHSPVGGTKGIGEGIVATLIDAGYLVYIGYRVHRMSRKDFDQSIQDNLVTHFNLQRSFVELLRSRNHGEYVAALVDG